MHVQLQNLSLHASRLDSLIASGTQTLNAWCPVAEWKAWHLYCLQADSAVQVLVLDLPFSQPSSPISCRGLYAARQGHCKHLLVPFFRASSSASGQVMHRNLRAVMTAIQLCLRCTHQMGSCQVACPVALMNLCRQERPSDLLLQTGIQPQALPMTRIKGQGPWSLLRLDL